MIPLVILAAGAASRMAASLADVQDLQLVRRAGGRQKGMIAVGPHYRPLLDYQLALAYRAGIRDIVLVIGTHGAHLQHRYAASSPGAAREAAPGVDAATARTADARAAHGDVHGGAVDAAAAEGHAEDAPAAARAVDPARTGAEGGGGGGADDLPSDLRIRFAVQPIPAGRSTPPGTADAVHCALDAWPELLTASFLVCNSDNLYSADALRALVSLPHRGGWIAYDRAGLRFDSARIARFGITMMDAEGWLTDIIEKPAAPDDAPASADGKVRVTMNIWKFFAPELRPALEACPVHPGRGEKELPAAVRLLIRAHPHALRAVPRCEHVPDLTSATDIPIVDALLQHQFPATLWKEPS